MGSTHLVIPDVHAHADYPNDRADWVGKLIVDLKPDVVVNLGDMWDLPSFSSYDKGRAKFHGRSYRKDLDAGLEFDDRLWGPLKKAKKKRPLRVFLEGNHEERMKRALDISPELDGVISFKDFQLDKNYDEVVEYQGNTPGIITIDGVSYAHYFISGVMARNVGGEHPAYSIITKQFHSATCGHIHTFDYAIRTSAIGKKIHGLVAGVYQDYQSPWAGEVNQLWNRGLVIKRGVENGSYDLEWVGINRLKEIYGK